MVIGKIKPTATLVAQFAAGVEVEAIQHEGKMYLPVVGMGEFSTSEAILEKLAKSVAPAAKKSEPEPEASVEAAPAQYSKDELMEMDSKELVKILKDEFGINPDDFDGKNTNKKLRDLILNAQKNGAKKNDEPEDDKPAPTKKRGTKGDAPAEDGDVNRDELVTTVGDYLEEFDAGKRNKKKLIAGIIGLVDDADEDKVTELVTEFEDDADADLDETAEKIVDVLLGKSEKKPAPAAKKGVAKKGAPAKKEKLVDVEDLEVGDAVSVYWDDDNQDWFNGEVKSIKKGKVTIKYEDGSEDVIDPEIHTKIKLLAE